VKTKQKPGRRAQGKKGERHVESRRSTRRDSTLGKVRREETTDPGKKQRRARDGKKRKEGHPRILPRFQPRIKKPQMREIRRDKEGYKVKNRFENACTRRREPAKLAATRGGTRGGEGIKTGSNKKGDNIARTTERQVPAEVTAKNEGEKDGLPTRHETSRDKGGNTAGEKRLKLTRETDTGPANTRSGVAGKSKKWENGKASKNERILALKARR